MCRRGVVGDGTFLKHLCHGRNFIEEIYIDSVNKVTIWEATFTISSSNK